MQTRSRRHGLINSQNIPVVRRNTHHTLHFKLRRNAMHQLLYYHDSGFAFPPVGVSARARLPLDVSLPLPTGFRLQSRLFRRTTLLPLFTPLLLDLCICRRSAVNNIATRDRLTAMSIDCTRTSRDCRYWGYHDKLGRGGGGGGALTPLAIPPPTPLQQVLPEKMSEIGRPKACVT